MLNRNSLGFITLPLMGWAAIAVGVVFIGLSIALKVQSARLESCKNEAAAFQAQVKANGELAEKEKARKEAEAKALKEKSDVDYKRLLGERNALANQLRDSRATGGILPKPATAADSTKPACFDRTLLESALQRLDAGVSGLVAEGDTLGIRLKLSQDWANNISPPRHQ